MYYLTANTMNKMKLLNINMNTVSNVIKKGNTVNTRHGSKELYHNGIVVVIDNKTVITIYKAK
jgi:hypothetical protein